MKLLIISDIHGSSYYAEKIKEIEAKENPDQIILLGDLYYHGPRNELTQEYNPMKVAGVLNDLKDKIRAVRGNCDAEVDEMISDFKFNDKPYLYHMFCEILVKNKFGCDFVKNYDIINSSAKSEAKNLALYI